MVFYTPSTLISAAPTRMRRFQLRWDAHPSRQPACLVPWTTGYTPACLASCGVSVTSHTPSLGVRPRLSPHPGHDDWNPGQLGFRPFCMQNPCQIVETQNSAIFLAFLRSPTLDVLDNFRQCPKCPNRRPPEVALWGGKIFTVNSCFLDHAESRHVYQSAQRLGLTCLQVELLYIKPESKSLNSIELG
jgi:hypothetical protein